MRRAALIPALAAALTLLAGALFAGVAEAADDPLASPWREVAPGVLAARGADVGADARWSARVVLVDPARAQLSVQFDELAPRLPEWRTRFPEAILIANGSFYSLAPAVRPTCDLISDGKLVHGAGCRVKDALYLGARASAPAGPRPRILAPAEFLAAEWSDALKSFPALVRAGTPACLGAGYCTEASRTAAIAVLRDGRLLFFASQWPAVRREVAQFLAEEMGAVDALNLDGGPEATLALRGESLAEAVSTPGTQLPLVIALLPAAPIPAPARIATPDKAAPASAPAQAQPAPARRK